MLLTAGSPEPAAARWPLIHCCQASAESIPGTHAACDATEKLTSPKSIFSKSPRAFVYGYVLPGPRCCDRGRRRKRCAAVLRLFGRAPRLLLLFAVQAGSGGVYIKLRYFHRHEWMLRHHALNIRKFTFDSWSKKKAGTSSSYPPDFVWLARHVCHCRHGISTVVAPPLFLATKSLVPGAGIEPARCHHRGILSPVRLPIPPSRQRKPAIMTTFLTLGKSCRIEFTCRTPHRWRVRRWSRAAGPTA